MFFSLTAPAPPCWASLEARLGVCRLPGPPACSASPRSRAAAGGRPVGPGTAPLCVRLLPLRACFGRAPARCPPCAHPGYPHLPGQASGLGSCSRPGRPATSSAPPPLAPPCCPRSAESLAQCQAAWEPSLGRELSGRVCVGRDAGAGGARGERPRCPAATPTPPTCTASPASLS